MRRLVVVGLLLLATACSDGSSASDATTGGETAGPETTGSTPAALSPVVALAELDGATVPAAFVLDVGIDGARSAKLVVDGDYVSETDQSPLRFELSLTPGEHRIRVRAQGDGSETTADTRFTVVGDGVPTSPTTGAATTATPASVPAVSAAPTPPTTAGALPSSTGLIWVHTPEELRAAIVAAQPGDVIVLEDGEYRFDDRLVAEPSGTETSPITLRGSRAAIIRTKNASGDYGLHITGDYWRVNGLTVAHATKGIVLDGSVGTILDGVEVFDIGDEGVHFRMCSSDGVLRNSFVHDTGRNSAQYGEGVYVGSANSNWDKYECTDSVEGVSEGDNTERVLIEDNVFEDITAEGADLKEGTDSGTIRNNVFRRVGLSGKNSADSAIDAKGNNWLIEGNVVSETDADWDDDGHSSPSEFADGFQSHSVYDGYGTHNTFRANRVEGAIAGFGIGLYPALDNVVTCDNEAPDAAAGLVGDNSKPAACG